MSRRWTIRLGCLLLGLLIALGANAAAPDAIVGTWLTEDGSSKVAVAATKGADGGTVYAGTVAWLKEPTRDGKPVQDANNPDAALRTRPILGLEILSGFKATPGSGHVFAATLAQGEPHPIAAPFTIERFHTGRLIDEAAAAAVTH